MTDESAAKIPCPKCGVGHMAEDGTAPCGGCGTVVTIQNFTPVLAAAELVPGEGRCQSHPAKDAVDACERCGGYVCDVCATRTGERLLCPTCFDWLHEREELETTVARRMRWDLLTSSLLVMSFLCNLALPFALVTACVTLWKRRKERYLSAGSSVLVLTLVLAGVTLIAVAIAGNLD